MQQANATRSSPTLLRPGEPPPGRFVAPADGLAPPRWEGDSEWATQHGPARCTWQKGKPSAASNVLMPNGARGNAQYAMFGAVQGWRRPVGKSDPTAEGWVFGTVELTDNDAVFLDDAVQPMPEPPASWGYPDLECDLWASAELGAACRNRRFATTLCRTLARQAWRYAFGGLWQCTAQDAGAIVANLRGRGENDRDYIRPDDPKRGADALAAVHEQQIEAVLSRIGWHALPAPQFDAIEADAKSMLAKWEARQEGSRPGWYLEDRAPQNAVAATRVGSLIRRIHDLASSDRLSQEEWHTIFALLHGEG
jgi:hypothetical protein